MAKQRVADAKQTIRLHKSTYSYVVRFSASHVPESFLSSQNHKPFESESSKIFSSRVRVRVMTWSSQSRVTKTVESLRVIGLQARVNVESDEISHFSYYILYAVKWRPIS